MERTACLNVAVPGVGATLRLEHVYVRLASMGKPVTDVSKTNINLRTLEILELWLDWLD